MPTPAALRKAALAEAELITSKTLRAGHPGPIAAAIPGVGLTRADAALVAAVEKVVGQRIAIVEGEFVRPVNVARCRAVLRRWGVCVQLGADPKRPVPAAG